MRNRLQYFYSITVFAGVLVTAYFMVDRQQTQFSGQRTQSATYRAEAGLIDPALGQLLQIENDLEEIRPKVIKPNRTLTRSEEDKPQKAKPH